MNKDELTKRLLNTAKGEGRRTYTETEAAELKAEGKTQGRKGLKLERKNIGLTPENFEYVRTMGQLSGSNASDFINQIIREHREAHSAEYAQVAHLKEKMKG